MHTKLKFTSININTGINSHQNSNSGFGEISKKPVEKIQSVDIYEFPNKNNYEISKGSLQKSNVHFANIKVNQRRSTEFSNYGEKGTLFA